MSSEKNGIVIQHGLRSAPHQHGCGHNLFLSKQTLQDICAIICPKCGDLIGLSLHGSERKKKLLKMCHTYSEKDLENLACAISESGVGDRTKENVEQ